MNTCGTTLTNSAADLCGKNVCLDGGWQILALVGLLALALAYAAYVPAAGRHAQTVEMANGVWPQQPPDIGIVQLQVTKGELS